MLKDYAKNNKKSGLLADASTRCHGQEAEQHAPKAVVPTIFKRRRRWLAMGGIIVGLLLVWVFWGQGRAKLLTLTHVLRAHDQHKAIKSAAPDQSAPTVVNASTKAKSSDAANNMPASSADLNDPTKNLAVAMVTPETDKQDLNQRLHQAQHKPETPVKKIIEPTFEFYQMLAAKHVGTKAAIKNADQAPEKADKAALSEDKATTTTAQTSTGLTLQVASFNDKKRVSPFRARLILLGFSPQVVTEKKQGNTMYRVLLGPFQNKEALQRAKDTLNNHGLADSFRV